MGLLFWHSWVLPSVCPMTPIRFTWPLFAPSLFKPPRDWRLDALMTKHFMPLLTSLRVFLCLALLFLPLLCYVWLLCLLLSSGFQWPMVYVPLFVQSLLAVSTASGSRCSVVWRSGEHAGSWNAENFHTFLKPFSDIFYFLWCGALSAENIH